MKIKSLFIYRFKEVGLASQIMNDQIQLFYLFPTIKKDSSF
jgi:hypothetical protein